MTHDSRNRTKVLLVEDEIGLREAGANYLRLQGFEVRSAATPREACRKAEEFEPDVVVSDWQLGADVTGVEVSRDIQRRFGSAVILMTARSVSSLRRAARDLDVTRCLQKPVSLAVLAETVSWCA